MSGVSRFLSRRDKKNPRHQSPHKDKDTKSSRPHKPAPRPDHFGGIFATEDDPKAKTDKDEERNIQGILERLRTFGIDTMVESNARYALRLCASQGSNGEAAADGAFKLLMLLQDTYEGIVKPFSPYTKLLGAVNRDSVTCYLDALLFAMFARLDSFEAMLYENFGDLPRKKLAGRLRLWVNMLRTGRLITVDVTKSLQEALAECGWEDASRLRQQDPSEAFTFITGQLELPLLTLKMDLHHAGKEEPQDDHKFINERLLEVAILDEPSEGNDVITLEDCLEHYFNNRIEVKRHMENQRRNTLKSASLAAGDHSTKVEKESGIHVEIAELASIGNTPTVQTPVTESPITPSHSKVPLERIRPTSGRKRGDSIFSQRKVELIGIDPEKSNDDSNPPPDRERKMSTRTEVLMPAWQFFKLLPWYTDHMPESDAQVAAHFSKKRPVLGICLKRYSFTSSGQATRRDTYIDIPTEIAVPNFVSDENMQEEGPLTGNFRLLLQSVVCHRGGASVHSGHYVTLCRGSAINATGSRRGSSESDDYGDPWMLFNDLGQERVTYVDIHEALKNETPYLLFYQVQPIGDDGHSIHDLPSYAEATSRTQSDVNACEKPYLNEPPGSENALEQIPSLVQSNDGRVVSDVTYSARPASGRPSLDITTTLDGPRGRTSIDDRRSIAFEPTHSHTGSTAASIRTDPTASIPSTPMEEKELDEKNAIGLLAVANRLSSSRRGSRSAKGNSTSKSRPPSNGPDTNGSRFSLNMSKITQKLSRGESATAAAPAAVPLLDPPASATVTEVAADDSRTSPPGTAIGDQAGDLQSDGNPKSVDTARPGSQQQHLHGLKPPVKAATTSLTKKEKAAMKQERKRARREEDRDCVVM